MRVLVGGVGYRFLRDGSLGPWLTEHLAEKLGAPPGVHGPGTAAVGEVELSVEDLSYGPVAISYNLRDRPAYDRLVVFAAVARGRPPGTITRYRWDGVVPGPREVQERVNEAVTGSLSLDNLIVVVGALGELPDDVRVIEVEPGDEGWGEGFSPAVEAALPEIEAAVLEEAGAWSSARR